MKKRTIISVVLIIALAAGVLHYAFSDNEKQIKEFTAFVAVNGNSYESNTRIREKIKEVTGANASTEWLTGQTAEEKIKSMISSGEYPDFMVGSDATNLLLEAGAYVAIDEYLDNYPYLKNYLTEEQWDSFRQADGHIYYIPLFGIINGQNMSSIQSGEAFWIQKRVLEWADYPTPKTLDEYFDLIEAYQKANPQTNGDDTIGFEILCDDWRYFCLENPPMFLAGYPNDGCGIVDTKTQKVKVYDTIPEAKQYYSKLNEMYHKGVVDKETFTLSYQQYTERLSTGRVLGMVDQYWEIMQAQINLYAEGKDEYTYVPFPIVANEGVEPQYMVTESSLNVAGGMGISVSCKDVEGALQFLNDLLSPEVMILRNWGEEGVDYLVDKDGSFYRSPEQRAKWDDVDYLEQTSCGYSYYPTYEGLLSDGINAVKPDEQPGEYYSTLSSYDKEFLDKYNFQTWSEFMGEEKEGEDWFPLYSATGNWSDDTDYGKADTEMDVVKREWLPKTIMSEDFEEVWNQYIETYEERVDVEAYESQLDKEIQKRIEAKKKYNSQ